MTDFNPLNNKPKPMADAELARRKKKQALYSKTGSTLGLSALGFKAGAIAAKTNPRTKKFGKPLDEAAVTAGIGGAGIGGIGGYNFAAYTREDARRDQARKRQKVSKAMTGESAFGVVHKRDKGTEVSFRLNKIPKKDRRKARAKNTAIGAGAGALIGGAAGAAVNPSRPLAGAALNAGLWGGTGAVIGATTPVPHHEVKRVKFDVRKAYDPEEKRQQRAGMLVGGGTAGTAALGYAATKQGSKALKSAKKSTKMERAGVKAAGEIPGLPSASNAGARAMQAQANSKKRAEAKATLKGASKLRLKAIKGGGKAALLGAGAAAAGTGTAIAYKRANTRGRTYRAWYDE
jgi:hypothetical protein